MSMDSAPKGLIHALELDGQGGASPLAWEEVNWSAGQNLWLHFDFEDVNSVGVICLVLTCLMAVFFRWRRWL
ncbi:hypothetical protein [Umboniibacter marinipuniceus]|uniref:Uncharacterized protein n=1 Tax=Umboniibacter marinipuniceus TaxID=569599 RepID=A0A3M0A8P3_9GAMM|nr:hypothetical protein [Umboniibacter marinipuniceus]RMA80986.1 hypothetical protein DFR27_0776 [Umboniibacter marinipuniceus]